jgi:hypothetical protein
MRRATPSKTEQGSVPVFHLIQRSRTIFLSKPSANRNQNGNVENFIPFAARTNNHTNGGSFLFVLISVAGSGGQSVRSKGDRFLPFFYT